MFERNRIDNVEHAAVPVELATSDGEVSKGRILVPLGRNMFELLNGPAAFLEFEPYGGERSFVAKSAIRNVKLINVPRAPSLDARLRERDGFDPYDILGVPARASPEEVKAAWHRLSKIYHPDRYATAELPEEARDYLAAMVRRVNAAYAALENAIKPTRPTLAGRTTPIYESGGGLHR